MQLSISEAEAIIRSGWAALQQGDARQARMLFERVTTTGQANAQVWLLLALACRGANDAKAEEGALDRLLAIEPQNLRALIMKGDVKGKTGDTRGAARFYKKARQIAATLGQLPPDLAAEMGRIESFLRDADRQFRAHLEGWLADKGVEETDRFRESLDIMLGEKQVYFQQPTSYYFPRLPQIQYYERSDFPWAERIEAAAADMRAEILAVLNEGGAFSPYMVADPNRPRSDFHGLVDNPEWSTFHLWEKGQPIEANVARCPRTFEVLRDVPLAFISVRSPTVMFSLLRPGARIPPHHGMLNPRLICHLPLIVPPGCGFRVGNETRQWEEGKLLVFDDTIEHEAWNDSGENRMLLIFDIWRPELTEEERRAVATMFEAVDSFGGDA